MKEELDKRQKVLFLHKHWLIKIAQIYLCFHTLATFRLQQNFFFSHMRLHNPHGLWSFGFETVSHYYSEGSMRAELEWSYPKQLQFLISFHSSSSAQELAERVNTDFSGLCVYVRMTACCVPSLSLFRTVTFSHWYLVLATCKKKMFTFLFFLNRLWAVNPKVYCMCTAWFDQILQQYCIHSLLRSQPWIYCDKITQRNSD